MAIGVVLCGLDRDSYVRLCLAKRMSHFVKGMLTHLVGVAIVFGKTDVSFCEGDALPPRRGGEQQHGRRAGQF